MLHGDNVAPCLYGGFVAVRSLDPLDIVPIPVPDGLMLRPGAAAHRDQAPRESRALLGNAIPLSTAVVQWANVAGLVAGLFRGDWDLIARSLEDVVAEPVRGHQVPAFREMKQAALDAGALGCSLSGSGPDGVRAVPRHGRSRSGSPPRCRARSANVAGIAGDRYVSAVGAAGARLVEEGVSAG